MTMAPCESFEHAGLAVRILWEEYIDGNDNPRTNQDGNLGVMFCDYAGYTLGDTDAPDPREQKLTCPKCKGSGDDADGKHRVVVCRPYGTELVEDDLPDLQSAERYIERHAPEGAHWVSEIQDCDVCEAEGEVEVGIVEYLKREHGARVILPLFVYEHGGITMSCGGRLDTGEDDFNRHGRYPLDPGAWDTSSVGVIFDTEESRETCGWGADRSDEEIEANLREEVKYYAAYLEGSVFGYEVIEPELDEDGEFNPDDCEGEVLGSCWGFLCAREEDFKYLRGEARSDAEYQRQVIEAEKAEALRWACADVVTV